MARAPVFSTRSFLRLAVAGALLAGCGDDANSFPIGDEDAAIETDVAVKEDTGGLTFDVVTAIDAGTPGMDVRPPIDTGTVRPDTGTVRPDTGTVRPDTGPVPMCPSSCAANSDCNPCRAAGETGNYCCISGLCLYMTDMCSSTVPTDGGMSTPGDGGGDGGLPGDGGAGLDAAGGADAAGGGDAAAGAG